MNAAATLTTCGKLVATGVEPPNVTAGESATPCNPSLHQPYAGRCTLSTRDALFTSNPNASSSGMRATRSSTRASIESVASQNGSPAMSGLSHTPLENDGGGGDSPGRSGLSLVASSSSACESA